MNSESRVDTSELEPLQSGLPKRQEEAGFRHFAWILSRRWRVILTVALIVFALVAFSTFYQKKVYTASTKLVVVTSSPQASGSDDLLAGLIGLRTSRNVDTQVEIINNDDLLDAAFRSLPLEKRIVGFGKETEPPTWSYDIKSRQDTDVIQIRTHAYKPEIAADFANALVDTYLKEDLEQNSQATRQAREYVSREKDKSYEALGQATAALAKYQREINLVDPTDQVSGLAKMQGDVRTAKESAEHDVIISRDRLRTLESQLSKQEKDVNASTTVSQNPEFALVQAQLIDAEQKLVEQSQEFTPNSPEIKAINSQISELNARLRKITKDVISAKQTQPNPVFVSLTTAYASAVVDDVAGAARAQALGKQLESLNQELKKYPDKLRTLEELKDKVDVLNRTYNTLSDKYYALLIQERSNVANGRVAGKAHPEYMPSSPRVLLSLIFGAVLATLLGLVTAGLLEKVDNKVRVPEDVERVSGLVALSLIPEASSETDRLFIGVAQPKHGFLESFRMLRNNIGFAAPDKHLRVLGVTSAAVSEGKSTVSVNLAIAMAMDGKKVLLVDTDLRRPTIHKWMDLPNDQGLTTVVRGLKTLQEAVQPTQFEGLWALPSGPLPPNPTEFLNSDTGQAVIRQASEFYDIVILDAPPSTGLSDIQVISTMVDGLFVVVTLDATSKPMLFGAMKMLRQAGAPLLGVVVNRVKKSTGGYYGSYGYYGYYSYTDYSSNTDTEEENNARRKKKSKKKSSIS